MNTIHTPAPWRVQIGSTCSGAWPEIVKDWNDPNTNEDWTEEIGRAETAFTFDYETHGHEIAATYNDRPELFKPEEGSKGYLANAQLMATAPELLAMLEKLCHLNCCEAEGIGSGMPTAKDWFDAYNEAADIIAKATTLPTL